jgi:LacI family transcriptional regulator
MLQKMNLSVPEQIGVTGFYGHKLVENPILNLSSIAVHPEELGKVAAELLISGDVRYRVHEIPMEFVFGETI